MVRFWFFIHCMSFDWRELKIWAQGKAKCFSGQPALENFYTFCKPYIFTGGWWDKVQLRFSVDTANWWLLRCFTDTDLPECRVRAVLSCDWMAWAEGEEGSMNHSCFLNCYPLALIPLIEHGSSCSYFSQLNRKSHSPYIQRLSCPKTIQPSKCFVKRISQEYVTHIDKICPCPPGTV
jgi:hypothetical protein